MGSRIRDAVLETSLAAIRTCDPGQLADAASADADRWRRLGQ